MAYMDPGRFVALAGNVPQLGKDVVELLERALFRLRHEEEDHDEGNDVQASVEPEGRRAADAAE